MASETEKWRTFDLLLSNFQAIGKWQSRFVNSLFVFLCLVWAVDLLQGSGGISIQVLGATIKIAGLWQIVPLVNTILCLGLAGSLNSMNHAWRRLDLFIPEVFADPAFFFTEFDPHKNILDYLMNLTISLGRPVLPDNVKNAPIENQRWKPRMLAYPALILFALFTTSFTLRRVEVTWRAVAYVGVCYLLQGLFSIPFLWRKACLFTGVHNNAYEGIDWRGSAS